MSLQDDSDDDDPIQVNDGQDGAEAQSTSSVDEDPMDIEEPDAEADKLFTIDTSATPIEELQAKNTAGTTVPKRVKGEKGKRKMSTGGQETIGVQNGAQRPSKRARTEVMGLVEPHPVEEVGDSFVKEVDARHTAKEEARKKKSDKKRKRESDGSVTGPAPAGQKSNEANGSVGKPKTKKPKKDKSHALEGKSADTHAPQQMATDTLPNNIEPPSGETTKESKIPKEAPADASVVDGTSKRTNTEDPDPASKKSNKKQKKVK